MKLSSPQYVLKIKLGKSRRRLRKQRRRKAISCENEREAISCQKPMYIPVDLQINVLLRLPVRSLLRFRCVSKLWSSMIASRDFRKQYSNSSRAPRLLVSLGDLHKYNMAVLSCRNPEGDACVHYRDLSVQRIIEGGIVCGELRGLIHLITKFGVGICNPSTRQLQMLPQLKFNGSDPDDDIDPFYLFGHDPIEDKYKMLAIDNETWRLEHKILVCGEGDWKEISCDIYPHTAETSGICMNGFIYYGGYREDNDSPPNPSILVCFDVRLEKFRAINVPQDLWFPWLPILINYRGKVGVVEHPRERTRGAFRMWVLEDAEKEEWSTMSFVLPKPARALDLDVMGFVSTGELCLLPSDLSLPFCIHYYSLETNRIRKVRIQGLPSRDLKHFHCLFTSVSEHYESLMFLET